MFREDPEFHDRQGSHLGAGHAGAAAPHAPSAAPAHMPDATQETTTDTTAGSAAVAGAVPTAGAAPGWTAEAERELKKIPFFVRGKARRNTESFAAMKGLTAITLDTLYDAKAHFSR
jgi:light-independent protochlorophyllide reductase subunit B